jgi:aminopeptidase N
MPPAAYPTPQAIHAARQAALSALAGRLAPRLPALIADLAVPGAFSAGAEAAGRRALQGAALGC